MLLRFQIQSYNWRAGEIPCCNHSPAGKGLNKRRVIGYWSLFFFSFLISVRHNLDVGLPVHCRTARDLQFPWIRCCWNSENRSQIAPPGDRTQHLLVVLLADKINSKSKTLKLRHPEWVMICVSYRDQIRSKWRVYDSHIRCLITHLMKDERHVKTEARTFCPHISLLTAKF